MAYDQAEAVRTALMAQAIVGLDLEDARKIARESGVWLRSVKIDGRTYAGRGDFRSDRILAEVEYGTVVKAGVG